MANDRLEREEEIKRIVASAERLARRMNAIFVLDHQKLSNFPDFDENDIRELSHDDADSRQGVVLSC